MKFFFKCSEAFPFSEVQAKLSSIEGVVSVAKLPGANPSAEEGLVEVESQEAGEAAVEAMGTVGAEYIPQPSASEDAKEAKASKARGEKKDKSVAKEFFDAVPKLTETRQRKAQESLDKHRRQEAAMNSNGKKDGRGRQQGKGQRKQEGSRSRSQGGNNRTRSGGRGGRGGYRSNSRGGRGAGGRGRGRGRGFHMPQFIEGHIASINNVPLSMTNDQIADLFNDCGVIYDIARYENLAMVYFDCQESVLNAIVKVNGTKKMNGTLACVSDGGVLRVPIPHQLNPQALSPQALRMHQQGMMPPLQNPMGGPLPPHLQQQLGGGAAPQQQGKPSVPAQ